ncbi:hypothetical protein [Paenibacillus taiwanensis]|uniref:hypothetical protein n=1 Tax=Paenibacillus taiwanensis TaxID=401638 RepID=UPI001B7FC98B|nr:hypothetical protein [Paenibacillus taiwanensis]
MVHLWTHSLTGKSDVSVGSFVAGRPVMEETIRILGRLNQGQFASEAAYWHHKFATAPSQLVSASRA